MAFILDPSGVLVEVKGLTSDICGHRFPRPVISCAQLVKSRGSPDCSADFETIAETGTASKEGVSSNPKRCGALTIDAHDGACVAEALFKLAMAPR